MCSFTNAYHNDNKQYAFREKKQKNILMRCDILYVYPNEKTV